MTDTKPTLPVGVSCLLIHRGCLLLSQRQEGCQFGAGWYCTPGGRIELDEPCTVTAIRELKEETSLIAKPADVKFFTFHEFFRFEMHYIMLYCIVKKWEGTIKRMEPDKHGPWEWHNLKQLPGWCTEPPHIVQQALMMRGSL